MSAIDWKAAEHIARGLGIKTRKLVTERDEVAARKWALEMASAHDSYGANTLRAASYFELAVLLGYEEPAEEDEEPEQAA